MDSDPWLTSRTVNADWCPGTKTHTKVSKLSETHSRACKLKSAILDGEIVALDSNGVSQFKELLYHRGRAVFFAFDLMWLDGMDLCQVPLIERKKKLKKLIDRSDCTEILYAQHIERDGKLLFEEVRERNLASFVIPTGCGSLRCGAYYEYTAP
jgi:bifunctional non-homologous end joining protein LigD